MQAPEPSSGRKLDLLRQALQRTSRLERAAFLDGACGSDASLRAEMEAHLICEAGNSGVAVPNADAAEVSVEDAITEVTATLLDETPVTEGPGAVVGRYKLLQKVGEGGCGVVYMAEQEEPVRRRVALKVIKLGMDTRSVVARFEAERQALAMMDHPNIARVLDAGATSAGRPYFVMDWVESLTGMTLDERGVLSWLEPSVWRERKKEFEQAGASVPP
jgi:eukaryotic-like serine/threonine-protein kinase